MTSLHPQRGLLVAAALLGFSGAQASAVADEEGPVPPTAEMQVTALLREVRRADSVRVTSIGRELSQLTPLALEHVCSILVERRVPEWNGLPEQVLSEPQQLALLGSLGGVQRGSLQHELDRLLASEPHPSVPRRATALRLLGAAGETVDMETLFRQALLREEQELDPELEQALEWGTTALLSRDPRATHRLNAMCGSLRPEVLPAALRSLGADGSPQGLSALLEVASTNPALSELATGQVQRLDPIPWGATSARFATLLREKLENDDPDRCRSASIALASLRDFDSTDELIQLLDHPHGGVRETAHWSLKKLTGLSFPPQARLWWSWLERERTWFRREYPELLERLESPRRFDVASAAQEFARHRLNRDELAAALIPLLADRDPKIRSLICGSLATLTSPDAIPGLLACLTDEDEEVSAAAHAALVALTQLDLPRDPGAWREALSPYL